LKSSNTKTDKMLSFRLYQLFFVFFLVYAAYAFAENNRKELDLIEAARSQIGVTKYYDGAYVRLAYPNGDVAIERGVCTDVVVRAYRQAFRYDLQKNVHEDMKQSFSSYPKNWGLTQPDANIDHRRVPNLQTFFTRKGALINERDAQNFKPGDLVTQMIGGRLPHIGIISNKRNAKGTRYLVIHNIGGGTQEEDILTAYPITGHYRFFSVMNENQQP